MYARAIRVIGNRFVHNRGAAGYGIGVEAADDAVVAGNVLDGDHVDVNMVDSPAHRVR